MWKAACLLILVAAAAGCASVQDGGIDEARRIARESIIVDTHIDVPYRLREKFEDVSRRTESGDFDYPRARAGGLDAAFMSIYIPPRYEEKGGAKALADELIDMVEKLAAQAPDKFAMADSPDQVRRNADAGLISFALGMENAAPIEGNLENLRHFYDRGIRYITLAHSKSNHVADSSFDDERPWNGLSEFGEKLVAEMNRIGVMVDVSHISDAAFHDVMRVTRAPVIASHSSARHFTPGFERNMSDELIEALAENGGVIQINFGSAFLDPAATAWLERFLRARGDYLESNDLDPEGDEATAFGEAWRKEHPNPFASLEDVLDHIDHVVELVGVDHVGLGSDFDGVGDSLPEGLKDVSGYPNLIAGLLERGYSEAQIGQILSGNILRVWTAVQEHAARQGTRPIAARDPGSGRAAGFLRRCRLEPAPHRGPLDRCGRSRLALQLVQAQHPIGACERFATMGDENAGDLEFGEHIGDVRFARGIQVARGLVQKQNARSAIERSRDQNALLLTSR